MSNTGIRYPVRPSLYDISKENEYYPREISIDEENNIIYYKNTLGQMVKLNNKTSDSVVLKRGEGLDSMMPAATSGGTGLGDDKDPTPVASARSAIALGRYNRATAKESVALNYNNKANGINSFVANANNTVNGVNSAAFGFMNTINATRSNGVQLEGGFVTGTGNTVVASNQTIVGHWSKTSRYTDDPNENPGDPGAIFIVGDGGDDARRHNALAVYGVDSEYGRALRIGDAIVKESTFNLINHDTNYPQIERDSMGGSKTYNLIHVSYDGTDPSYEYLKNKVLKGGRSVALGAQHTISANYAIALNLGNTVSGDNAFAANANNIVAGSNSAVFGYINQIPSELDGKIIEAAFVAGTGNMASKSSQVVFGTFNEKDKDALFILGSGYGTDFDSATRKNALVVYPSGNIKTPGDINSNGIISKSINISDIVTLHGLDVSKNNINILKNISQENVDILDQISQENVDILDQISQKDVDTIQNSHCNDDFSKNTLDQIINACRTGNIPSTWKVGNKVKVDINGTQRTIAIIGENTDTFETGEIAPLTFQFDDLTDEWKFKMHDDNSEVSIWKTSSMRNEHLESVLESLPKVLRDSIAPVIKHSFPAEDGGEYEATVDKLFLVSMPEIYPSTDSASPWYHENGAGLYDEFYSSQSLKKYDSSGVARPWWTRNRVWSGSNKQYGFVNEYGQRAPKDPNEEIYVAPAFCIYSDLSIRVGNTFVSEDQMEKIIDHVNTSPEIYSGSADPNTLDDFGKDGDIYVMFDEE